MPIVRLGAGQCNSTGKANVFGKQYGDTWSGTVSFACKPNSSKRAMKIRGTNKIEKIGSTGASSSSSSSSLVITAPPLAPDPIAMWKKIGDIDGEAEDESGYSVSLSDDGKTLAIGTIGNDNNTGHTRIYTYNDISWNQIAEIRGESPGEKAGYSVSLSGDGKKLVVGSPYNGVNSGVTRTYKYNDDSNAWVKIQQDSIYGKAAGDESGYSVSLSGDGNTLAIGAINYDYDNKSNAGHTRIFKWNTSWGGGYWEEMNYIIITDVIGIRGDVTNDKSGYSVSLSGDGNTLAIGAPYNDGNGTESGHTRIYRYNNNGNNHWELIGSEILGEAAGDESGHSVSLSGDGKTLAIGAPYNDGSGNDSGHTRIYKYDGVWNPIGLIPGDAPEDKSGYSVSLSIDGNTLAIGTIGNDNNTGHTRIYKYDVDGSWNQIKEIPGEAAQDYSGHSVSLSGDGKTLAIGAPYNDGSGNISGLTQIYTYKY